MIDTGDSKNRMTGMSWGGVNATVVYDGNDNLVKGRVGGVMTAHISNYYT